MQMFPVADGTTCTLAWSGTLDLFVSWAVIVSDSSQFQVPKAFHLSRGECHTVLHVFIYLFLKLYKT